MEANTPPRSKEGRAAGMRRPALVRNGIPTRVRRVRPPVHSTGILFAKDDPQLREHLLELAREWGAELSPELVRRSGKRPGQTPAYRRKILELLVRAST